MPRLFTGIEIPDEQREEIARLRQPLPGSSRWMEPENLHLTLRFAGDIDNAHAREFADRLAGIDVDAFEIRLAGIGAFGGNEPRSAVGRRRGGARAGGAGAGERARRARSRIGARRPLLQAARDGGAFEIRQRLRRRPHPRPPRRLPQPAVHGGTLRSVLLAPQNRRRTLRGGGGVSPARRRVRRLRGRRRRLVAPSVTCPFLHNVWP